MELPLDPTVNLPNGSFVLVGEIPGMAGQGSVFKKAKYSVITIHHPAYQLSGGVNCMIFLVNPHNSVGTPKAWL